MSSYSKTLEELRKKYKTNTSGGRDDSYISDDESDSFSSYDETRRKLREKYSSENVSTMRTNVSSWVDRYNSAMNGIASYNKELNGRYTKDVSGGYGREIDSLLKDYDSIKDYAHRMGLPNVPQYVSELRKIQSSIRSGNEYMAQFADENDFNEKKRQAEEYEALKNFDTQKGESEVQHLEKVLNEYKALSRTMIDEKMQERLDYITANYGGEKSLKSLISEKKQYLNRAKRLQEGITLAGVINNDDFQDHSGYTSTKLEDDKSKRKSEFRMGYEDLTYEYINGEESGMRQDIIDNAVAYDADTDKFFSYDYMTDDQIATYNYYYAKDGKEAADKYLDSIQETLNYQAATERYEKMEGKTALELMFGFEAGVDQFQSGMKNVFNTEDDYIAQTATQMASGMVREDLADDGAKLPDWLGGGSLAQAGYDAITTTSNMLPSIMTSTVMNIIAPGSGAVAGSLMMGASAAGNAYQEMLNLGYDKSQARAYSTLVGASEAGLQYLLGGISELGGKLSGNVLTKMMSGIDNAFLRTALKLGGGMLSEGAEEGLQEILSTWMQNLIMHTDEDINWSEVAYSTLLGALTAGVMEGHTTIGDAVSIRNTGKQLQTADISAARLAELGQTFSADTVAYQLAGRVNESTGAYTIGRLFNEIGATLSEQNVTEITEALVAKGMDKATAQKNAEVFAYVIEGGKLNNRQVAMIEANEVLAEAARTTLIDANTTWNQRTKGYNEALMALAQEKTSRTNPAKQSEQKATVSDTVDTQNENGAQSLSEADAVDTSPAKVKSISSIGNGQVTVKLADGTEVNVKEADLSVDDGVRIETISQLENISAADANFILNTLRTNTGTSAQIDSLGAREAYKYGFYGFSQEHMTTHGVFANSLTETQRNAIYETGRAARQKQMEAKQATVAKNATAPSKVSGKVHFEGDHSNLTERQRASLTAMEKVAEILGVQVYVFESKLNESGKRVGANGWYDTKDGSIHIDLHAGENGAGTMLFTMAHELTHHIRQWSPAKFKVLADFLMQEYGKKGVNVDALVREQMAKAKRNGRTISYDTAYEEVVADSMEIMLADGKVMEKLAKLKAQDKSLWQKIKDFISELAAKIRSAYEGMSPDSVEGRHVAEMVDSIERLQDLFAEGLVDASENFQSAEKNTTKDGGEVKYSQKYLEADMNSEILAMVNRVANRDFKANEKVYLGNVPDAIAEQISKLTGIRVNGFKIAIEARQIDHIMKDHGVNGDADHSMADPNDIAKMEYALGNPDDIRKAGKTQAYTYMRNGRNRTADTILYEKKIGAKSYYVVQAVPDTKAKTLYIVTAFIGPSGYKKEASQLINAKGPDATVKTGSANASNESIRSESEVVNNESIADNFVKEYKDSHKGVKYSDRDSRTYAEIEDERQSLRQREMMLEERKRKAVNDPELLQAMDAYSGLFTEMRELLSKKHNGTATQAELDRIEEIKHLREESMKRVADLQESLGLNAISQEETEIRETKEALRIASDAAWAREGAEKENKAIEKAGVSAPEYFRKKALKAFKTTTNFNEAGYLLPDGKLLNFSGGERNHRYRDHREIGEIYEATQGAAALNRFMSDGNIRIMAESPGVDITSGTEPTNEQYAALRKFVNSHGVNERKFFVDFSDADGHRDGNYSYEGRVNADRVINDIKHYYATGEIREQSSVAQFLWSYRDTESVSNRSLLANAFESVAKNDIERQKIQEYKDKIARINAEERRLAELSKKIKDLSFAKGPKNTKAITDLQIQAKQTANRISTYDKQLLRLEASKPLQDVLNREKKLAYQRAEKKGKEALEAYREKTMKYQQELVDKWEESRKRGIESRQKADMRQKIRKAIRELDKILNHGDKKKNVKEEMKGLVSSAIQSAEVLFTDNYSNEDILRNGFGVQLGSEEKKHYAEAKKILDSISELGTGYEVLAKREELNKKLSYRMAQLREAFYRERNRLNETRVSEVLSSLADAYYGLQSSETTYIKDAYHASVHEYLKYLQNEVGGTTVRDMNMSQLESLNKAYTMVLETVRNANKMFNEKLKESRDQLANAVMREVKKAGGEHGSWSKLGIKLNQFSWNNMKPIYAAERIGSETFSRVVSGLFDGQYKWATTMEKAREFQLQTAKKYKVNNWDMEKTYKFSSSNDLELTLNLEQILALYAYSKREAAHDHITSGGVVFGKNTEVKVEKLGIKVTRLKRSATTYTISDTLLGEIISKLDDSQKKYVDEMQKYLSETIGGLGNEVSMKLYGVKLFGEENYFPLRSAGQYMEKAKEADLQKEQGHTSLVNSGFTHAVRPNAQNPIVLDGFMDVWASHVNDMAMYNGMVLPMEDFRKVYHYHTPFGGGSASVNGVIENAYGAEATNYFDQLYQELNSGAISDPRETDMLKWVGKFKKASVMASMSVVVQQPSAIGRAFALIDPKHFVGQRISESDAKKQWDEVKKYAPVAIIKEMGGFDTHTGASAKDFLLAKEYSKDEIGKALKDKEYLKDKADMIMGYLPAKADELTWVAIWQAVKREVRAKNSNLHGEAFLRKAGERFSEVIEKTQVYDSILARSANMRAKTGLMTMATAFLAEPTTTVNMLENAILYSKKNVGRVLASVVTSIILNNLLASAIYAMRDDDEDETWREKYVQAFASGMVDDINPLTYYPFLKDVWSLLQGYDVERSDMSVVADVTDALKKAIQVIGKKTTDMDEDELAEHRKAIWSAVLSLADGVSSAIGIPFKNVRREVESWFNTYNTATNGLSNNSTSLRKTIAASIVDALPVASYLWKTEKSDNLYDAFVNGDTSYVERLRSEYDDEKQFTNAIRKGLRENDSRIYEAALAQINGHPEERVKLQRQVIADGFKQDDVVAATNTLINKLSPSASTSEPKKKGLYSTEDFALFVANGKASLADEAKKDIIATHQLNGKTADEAEKSFQSSAKTDLKEMFLAGTVTVAAAEHALKTYCGLNANEAKRKVNEWNYFKSTGIDYSDKKENFLSGELTAGDLINSLIAVEGKTEEEAASTVISYTRDAYEDGFFSRSKAADIMVSYGGLTEEKAESKLRYIDIKKQFPDTTVDDAWVDEYYNEVESSGITIGVFLDYRNQVKSITGDGKKERRMAVINSMPISDAQKDALYFAEGWAASKLYEAPWR